MTPLESEIRADTSAQAPLPFDPDDDDRLIGRVLSRREVLALMGAASVSVVAAACAPGSVGSAATGAHRVGVCGGVERCRRPRPSPRPVAAAVASALPSCVVVPELTEGPYYVDEKLRPLGHPDRHRRRLDRARATSSASTGSSRQVDGSACIPLEGVLVDVWHCDALGDYSDVGGRAGPRLPARLPAHRRGRQGDDHDRSTPAGTRAAPSTSTSRSGPTRRHRAASSSRRSCSSTTPLSAQVYATGVYATKGTPDRLNASDSIYQQSQGMTLLDVVKDGERLHGDLRDRGPDDLAGSRRSCPPHRWAEDGDRRRDADPDPGHDRRREQVEVADHQDVEPEPVGERIAGPRAEDRGDHDDRQAAARRAADEDEQRGVEDADQDGKDRAPVRGSRAPSRRARRSAGSTLGRTGAGRAIRPPPSTTSPSYSTAAWPGAAAHTGASVSTSQRPPRAGSAADAGRTVAGIGVARWRIRTSARNGARPSGASPATKRRAFELDGRRLEVLAAPERDRVRSAGRSG